MNEPIKNPSGEGSGGGGGVDNGRSSHVIIVIVVAVVISIKEKISNEERDRNNKNERTNKTPWERVMLEGGEVGSGRSWRFIIIVAERLAIKKEKEQQKIRTEREKSSGEGISSSGRVDAMLSLVIALETVEVLSNTRSEDSIYPGGVNATPVT